MSHYDTTLRSFDELHRLFTTGSFEPAKPTHDPQHNCAKQGHVWSPEGWEGWQSCLYCPARRPRPGTAASTFPVKRRKHL